MKFHGPMFEAMRLFGLFTREDAADLATRLEKPRAWLDANR
jgi:hypothetical protein